MRRDLSDAIREAREAKCLTQEELADNLGFAQQVISRWETGKNTPSGDVLLSLDSALDTNLSVLCSDTERSVVIGDERCSGVESCVVNAAKALNPNVNVPSLLSVLRSVRDSSDDDVTDCMQAAEMARESMNLARADILAWCAYHIKDYEENPVVVFNRELKDSLNPDVWPSEFRRDTRLGSMTREEYVRERAYLLEFSLIFGGEDRLSREEIAARIFYMYGRLPDYLVEYDLHLKRTEQDFERCLSRKSQERGEIQDVLSKQRYAGCTISRLDLAQYDDNGDLIAVNHSLDCFLSDTFRRFRDAFEQDFEHFSVVDGSLLGAVDGLLYVGRADDGGLVVTDDFYRFLLAQPDWLNLASGVIERRLYEWQF